jgi:HEAT repeat protein
VAENLQDLIEQLKQISPMPDDDDLTDEILLRYYTLIEELGKTGDPVIIDPLLYSIGFLDGEGTYDAVVYFLEKFELAEVLPHLIEATQRGQRGTRYWSARMLGRIGTLEVVSTLIAMLDDPEEEVRVEAIRALAKSDDPNFVQYIKPLENDPSPEVRRAVERVLSRV